MFHLMKDISCNKTTQMHNVLINQWMRITEPLDPLKQILKVLSWAHHFPVFYASSEYQHVVDV